MQIVNRLFEPLSIHICEWDTIPTPSFEMSKGIIPGLPRIALSLMQLLLKVGNEALGYFKGKTEQIEGLSG